MCNLIIVNASFNESEEDDIGFYLVRLLFRLLLLLLCLLLSSAACSTDSRTSYNATV